MADSRDSIIFEVKIENNQAVKDLGKLNGQISKLKREQKELNKSLEEGNISQKQYNEETAKLGVQLKNTRAEYRRVEKSVTAASGSLQEQRQELIKLKKQFANLNPDAAGFEDLRSQINEITNSIRESEQSVQVFSRDVGRYKESIVSAFDEVGISLGRLATGPLAAAFAAEKIIEATQAAIEYAEELRKITILTQQLTGASGFALDQIISKTQTIVEIYDKDYQEVLVATNAVANQFGITQSEALDKVQSGFIAGADSSDEFLDILRQYSPQFRQIGLDAEESIAIITQQVKQGVFSDKGVDILREASERLTLFPKATSEALDAIGLSSSEIQESIENGTSSIFEVIRQVSGRLGELPPKSREVGTAIEQVFGTPGLEVGLPLLLELQGVSTELDVIIEKSGSYAQQQRRLVESTNLLNAAQNRFFNASEGGFGRILNNIKIFGNNLRAALLFRIVQVTNGFIDFINGTIDGFATLRGAILSTGNVVDFVGTEFGRLGTLIKTALTDIRSLPTVATELLAERRSDFEKLGTDFGESIASSLERAASSRLERINFFNISDSPASQGVSTPTSGGSVSARNSSGSTGGRRQLPSIAPILTDPDALDAKLKVEEQQISSHLARINELRAEEVRQFELTEEQKRELAKQTQDDILDGVVETGLAATNSFAALASSIETFADGIARSSEEGSEAEKRAQKVRKRAATAGVIFSSAAAIAEAIKTAQTLSGQFPPFSIPIGIAYGAAQTGAIIANRIAQIKEINKFEKGGQVIGPSHSQGGVITEMEGGEYVIRKSKVNPATLPFLEAFNAGRLPIPRFQDGGIVGNLPLPSFVNQGFTPESVPRSISMDVEKMEAAFSRALVNMKPQVLSLTQLETAQNTMAEINDGATI